MSNPDTPLHRASRCRCTLLRFSEFVAARDVVADTPTITLWVESRARVCGKPILFSPTDRWGLRALLLQSGHAWQLGHTFDQAPSRT
jgi:hypothetical protein